MTELNKSLNKEKDVDLVQISSSDSLEKASENKNEKKMKKRKRRKDFFLIFLFTRFLQRIRG